MNVKLPAMSTWALPRRLWVLMAGDLRDDEPFVLAGACTDFTLSHSLYRALELSVRMAVPYRTIQGLPLDSLVWEGLKHWPDEQAGRRQPAELEALLELAGRHPEEYEDLREKIMTFRALGG